MVEQPDNALKFLNDEQAFLHGVESRIHELEQVLDLVTGQNITDFRLSAYPFGTHCRTDSQLAHRLLLRHGLTAHEIEVAINSMPVNRAIAWQVEVPDRKLLREPAWQPGGTIVAAVCWSPLPEIVSARGDCLSPGYAADAVRLVNRMSFLHDAVVWLAVGSTTGWREPLPRIIRGHVHCVYFVPAPFGGWAIYQAPAELDAEWAATYLHPESDQQLEVRLTYWFEDHGRRIAMAAAGLTVDMVRDQAGVPERLAEVFLITVASEDPARWLYEPEKQRLVFLGP